MSRYLKYSFTRRVEEGEELEFLQSRSPSGFDLLLDHQQQRHITADTESSSSSCSDIDDAESDDGSTNLKAATTNAALSSLSISATAKEEKDLSKSNHLTVTSANENGQRVALTKQLSLPSNATMGEWNYVTIALTKAREQRRAGLDTMVEKITKDICACIRTLQQSNKYTHVNPSTASCIPIDQSSTNAEKQKQQQQQQQQQQQDSHKCQIEEPPVNDLYTEEEVNGIDEKVDGISQEEASLMAEIIVASMTTQWRNYHAVHHVFEVAGKARPHTQPIHYLAALFHDVVYLQLDEGTSIPCLRPLYHAGLRGRETDGDLEEEDLVSFNDDEELIHDLSQLRVCNFVLLGESACKKVELCLNIFGYKKGMTIPCKAGTPGMNEFLSAIVAAQLLAPYLTHLQIIDVAACIEATIPFRDPTCVSSLLSRTNDAIQDVFQMQGVNDPDEVISKRIASGFVDDSCIVALRDLHNFYLPDTRLCLTNTWRLLSENCANLRFVPNHDGVAPYLLSHWIGALRGNMKFFSFLHSMPERVFPVHGNVYEPSFSQMIRNLLLMNLRRSRLYVSVRFLTACIVHALLEYGELDVEVKLLETYLRYPQFYMNFGAALSFHQEQLDEEIIANTNDEESYESVVDDHDDNDDDGVSGAGTTTNNMSVISLEKSSVRSKLLEKKPPNCAIDFADCTVGDEAYLNGLLECGIGYSVAFDNSKCAFSHAVFEQLLDANLEEKEMTSGDVSSNNTTANKEGAAEKEDGMVFLKHCIVQAELYHDKKVNATSFLSGFPPSLLYFILDTLCIVLTHDVVCEFVATISTKGDIPPLSTHCTRICVSNCIPITKGININTDTMAPKMEEEEGSHKKVAVSTLSCTTTSAGNSTTKNNSHGDNSSSSSSNNNNNDNNNNNNNNTINTPTDNLSTTTNATKPNNTSNAAVTSKPSVIPSRKNPIDQAILEAQIPQQRSNSTGMQPKWTRSEKLAHEASQAPSSSPSPTSSSRGSPSFLSPSPTTTKNFLHAAQKSQQNSKPKRGSLPPLVMPPKHIGANIDLSDWKRKGRLSECLSESSHRRSRSRSRSNSHSKQGSNGSPHQLIETLNTEWQRVAQEHATIARRSSLTDMQQEMQWQHQHQQSSPRRHRKQSNHHHHHHHHHHTAVDFELESMRRPRSRSTTDERERSNSTSSVTSLGQSHPSMPTSPTKLSQSSTSSSPSTTTLPPLTRSPNKQRNLSSPIKQAHGQQQRRTSSSSSNSKEKSTHTKKGQRRKSARKASATNYSSSSSSSSPSSSVTITPTTPSSVPPLSLSGTQLVLSDEASRRASMQSRRQFSDNHIIGTYNNSNKHAVTSDSTGFFSPHGRESFNLPPSKSTLVSSLLDDKLVSLSRSTSDSHSSGVYLSSTNSSTTSIPNLRKMNTAELDDVIISTFKPLRLSSPPSSHHTHEIITSPVSTTALSPPSFTGTQLCAFETDESLDNLTDSRRSSCDLLT